MIQCEFKRTIFSEASRHQAFMPGASLAEIVAAIDGKPLEFASHGVVILKRSDEEIGWIVERENWSLVRPKSGTKVFATTVPRGGGGGEGNGSKNTFAIVGAIALIALTAWVGGGGLMFLAPTLLGAGTVGAQLAGAAIGLAGAAGLQLLSKPKAGLPQQATPSAGIEAQSAPGVAGITQNPLTAYTQIPAVRGTMRVSPPLLARPFTTLENNDQVVNLICGICGPASIANIKINETAIADLPSGVLDYETLEGWSDDALLTLITESAFEENVNLPMSTHRLETDGATLVDLYTGSYPKAHIIRSARNTDTFRITLNFAGGLFNYNSADNQTVAFRIRMRLVGDATWIKFPEMHVNASRRDSFRQEIYLAWGNDTDEDALGVGGTPALRLWKRFYYENSEWTANNYFNDGGSGATKSTLLHVYPDADAVTIHLDEDTFPRGQYDIEITRGCVDASSNHTDTSYTAGMFTYRTLTAGVATIPGQSDKGHQVAIESYTSFRNEYPIAERGLALIAIKARNLQINSISAEFSSYVNVWNGANWDDVAVSSNPAALWRDVWTGELNARPVATTRLEDEVGDWYDHCVNEGLSCNHVVTQGSVEQSSALIAACGDATTRDSDKLGAVIDRDRSDEPIGAMYHQGNITSPLVVTKNFVMGARAIVANFRDSERDYASRNLDAAVFDDGVPGSADALTEEVTYDGYVSEAGVTRRAQLDLRKQRLRTIKYSWGTHLSHIKSKKGGIVGLSHDILLETYGQGRVVSYTESAGNLVTITLNTEILDLPATSYVNFFAVENVFALSDVFKLDGPAKGLQIELLDSSVVIVPIASASGKVLTVSGAVTVPTGLADAVTAGRRLMASVGRTGNETRRVIITAISPKNDFFAQIEAIDEAPEIFADGLGIEPGAWVFTLERNSSQILTLGL